MAFKVLREILRNQPARFKNYAELTIMKTLEAHKDPHKEVSNQLFSLFEVVTKYYKMQQLSYVQKVFEKPRFTDEVICVIMKMLTQVCKKEK